MKVFILIALVCSIYISDIQAVRCRAGYPTLGKGVTAPNLPDTDCSGPNYEDLCYVMFTDYNLPGYDKEAYTYGCILKVRYNVLITQSFIEIIFGKFSHCRGISSHIGFCS